MKIIPFEQSGFIFETESGFRLALDIGNKTPLEKLNGVTADAVLISHIHGDHFCKENINALSSRNIFVPNSCKQDIDIDRSFFDIVPHIWPIRERETNFVDPGNNISFRVFSVDHGPNLSAPLQENFGFLITGDGQTVYFAGDMFYESGIDVSNLEVDVALLPIGTFYTFGPEEAIAFAKKFKKIGKVIPMHYEKTPETREQFINLAVAEGINTEKL
jgi:L-ascorbate metabolism protein UlaG (beta-lactamase superfamily)